jgi:hypothetical protein
MPVATSDLGSRWGGTDVWVRGQGEACAKALWYHSRSESASMISIDWADMTADEKEENRVWCEAFIENSREAQTKDDSTVDSSDITKAGESIQKELNRIRRECRGGCGVKHATNVCSRCKEICKSLPMSLWSAASHLCTCRIRLLQR